MARRNGRKQVVVLGGGSGGVVAATNLGRKIGERHDVILIDKRPDHIFMPAFLFVMIGERDPRDITRSLKQLEKRNIRFVQSEVLGIDPDRQQVELQDQKIAYDYLIVSLGMQVRPDLIPGFTEASINPWELEGAVRLRDALASFNGGRIVVGVPLGPYRCPPAPYETQWLLDSYFKKRGIRDRVQIEYFTRDPEPTGEHRNPAVWMDDESRRRNIKQNYEFVVRSIDPTSKVVLGLYGYKISYDMLIMVPPHRPAQALLDCGLAETENGIRIDYETMRTKWDNVYAIGDCADMPASKAGGVAHQEADVVAHNLAVEITGKGRRVDLWLHTI
ncbi:MAG TPA: FAD/NAD(P)-binding oxidoreductase [Candidatus Binatia bacterium]|jgi:sulfide:quinone oxidoreductase|nr:FAD/NAD(P)-binding oxidoreductase [Candidatus Binatia bacterium]